MMFDMQNVARSINAGLTGGAIFILMRPNVTLSLSFITSKMPLYDKLGVSTAGAHLIFDDNRECIFSFRCV